MRIGIIIAVVLILLIAVYYFFIRPSSSSDKPAEGSSCSTVIGAAPNGTIKNGVCVVSATPINQTPIILVPINPKPKFKVGDDVFLNLNATSPATQDGIPVYKAPISNSAGTYLLGVVRPEWYYPAAIGKYVSDAGNGWSRVTVYNLKLWKFAGTYTTTEIYITQDVFFKNSDIQNKPY